MAQWQAHIPLWSPSGLAWLFKSLFYARSTHHSYGTIFHYLLSRRTRLWNVFSPDLHKASWKLSNHPAITEFRYSFLLNWQSPCTYVCHVVASSSVVRALRQLVSVQGVSLGVVSTQVVGFTSDPPALHTVSEIVGPPANPRSHIFCLCDTIFGP